MNRPIAGLLVAQAIVFGLSLAFLVIPGAAVFLDVYGAGRLPYVYLAVAMTGATVSWALTRAEQRLGLTRLAISTMGCVTLVALACWLVLATGDRPLASAVVLVLFNFHLQLGFVFIGAQAGRAFDVQRIKRLFPRFVAGFVFGFMVGGAVADPLIALLDRANHLLAVGVVALLLLGVLMAVTTHQLPRPTPSPAERPAGPVERRGPGAVRLLAIPLVGAVFAYQILSAMGTQLVEYLVYDQAAHRYVDANELASFVGRFTAVLNLTDLVVLVAVGGFLMSRFGLRFGLGANPMVVTALLIASVAIAVATGPRATSLFVLAGIARIADLTMADLATRTSVNATFQALPTRDRIGAQVAVEGAGVPVALGLTAALILGINAVSGGSVTWIVVTTAVVCLAWCGLAVVVYREYRRAVVVAVRRRLLEGDGLDFTEPVTREALMEISEAGTAVDVAVATGILVRSGAGEVGPVLTKAAASDDPDVRLAVLDHLVAVGHDAAPAVALEAAGGADPDHRLAGLRALGRVDDAAAVEPLRGVLDRPGPADQRERAAALGSLLRRRIDLRGRPVSEEIGRLASSPAIEDRLLAARAITEAEWAPDPTIVAMLLVDDDATVRSAACDASAALPDSQQAALLDRTAGGATAPTTAVLRACRGAAGDGVTSRVASFLTSDAPPDQADVVTFLLTAGWTVGDGPESDTVDASIEHELARIEAARRYLLLLGPEPARPGEEEAMLRRALDQERVEARQRMLDLLGLFYGAKLSREVGMVLAGVVDGDAAIALEALDVTLDPRHRGPVVAALRADGEGSMAGADVDRSTTVLALARSPGWAAHPDWLQACALAAADAAPGGVDLDRIEPVGAVTAELLAHLGPS